MPFCSTGKPTNQGINQLKYQRSLRSTAEERVGRRCANLRVLNSYWINQDSTYKYFEVILVDPSHKAIRRDPRINWIVNPVHKVCFLPAECLKSSAATLRFGESTANELVFSTENLVASLLPARSLVAWARDTLTTTLPLDEERPGSDTTPSAFGDTDKRIADAVHAGLGVDVDETSDFYIDECAQHGHGCGGQHYFTSGRMRANYQNLIAWWTHCAGGIFRSLVRRLLSIISPP